MLIYAIVLLERFYDCCRHDQEAGRGEIRDSCAKAKRKTDFDLAGHLVRDLGLVGRTPAVCSALTGKKFWESNNLRLLKVNGPKSGQSTTVVCTYEFVETKPSPTGRDDPMAATAGRAEVYFY